MSLSLKRSAGECHFFTISEDILNEIKDLTKEVNGEQVQPELRETIQTHSVRQSRVPM